MSLNTIQNKAIEKLSCLKAGALFMRMGTGKTRVALELVKSRQNDFEIVIWLAPASLLRSENYQNEIEKWSAGLQRKIHFFSIESVSASDFKYMNLYNLAKTYKTFCVVDESITIKNKEAGRTRRLLNIWNLFMFRLILNGTALTKGLIDLYSQIQFIHPGILNMTEAQFANTFLVYKKEGYRPWMRWSRPENEAALIEIIHPYIFDADLDIPVSRHYVDVQTHLSDIEAEEYRSQKESFLQGKYNIGFLEVAQKLQHFYTLCHEKVLKIQEIISNIQKRHEKVILYVKFIDEASILSEMFDAALYTGARKDGIHLFEKEKDILVSTYGTGSLGLNLQFCNNIIYVTQTFDFKDKEQSEHRIFRTGQKKDCYIFNCWVNTGLDALIKKSLEKKRPNP